MAVVYTISVGISNLRYYISIVTVIEETGTMNLAPGKSRMERWLNQSRLSDVVNTISTDKAKYVWFAALGAGALVFAAIWGLASASNSPLEGLAQNDTLTILSDFYYPPRVGTIQYPSCTIGKPFGM